jgi:hypothetical protein
MSFNKNEKHFYKNLIGGINGINIQTKLKKENLETRKETFCRISQKEFVEVLQLIEGKLLNSNNLYHRFKEAIIKDLNWVCVEASNLLPGNCLKKRKLIVVGLKEINPQKKRITFEVSKVDRSGVRDYHLYLGKIPRTHFMRCNSECVSRDYVHGKFLTGILMKPLWCEMQHNTISSSPSNVFSSLKTIKYLSKYKKDKGEVDYNWVCSAMMEFLPKICLLKNGWKPIKLLGAGVFGVVFEVKNINTGELAAFKIVIENEDTYISPKQEIVNQIIFSKEGLGPKVYCVSSKQIAGEKVYGILMERIDMILKDFLMKSLNEEQKKIFIKSLLTFLSIMRDKNFTHGDMHTENIALIKDRKNPMKLKLVFIDFGMSSTKVADTRLDASQFLRGFIIDCKENEKKHLPFNCKKRFIWLKIVINTYLRSIGKLPVTGSNKEFISLFKRYKKCYL